MDVIKRLHWPLILGLAAVAMVRPLVSTVACAFGTTNPPAVPIAVSILITVIWVGVVGFSRVRHPYLTLLFVGLVYAAFALVFSGVLSPIITGRLQGPLATPIAIVPLFVTNAIWGSVAGLLALGLQRARGFRPEH